MKNRITVGQRVKFSPFVLECTAGDARVKAMRGIVTHVNPAGQIASVDCGDTYPAEDGRKIRCIPTKNLVEVK